MYIYIYAIFCRFKTRKAIVFFSVHFLLIDRYFVWKGYNIGYITTTLYRHAVHWIWSLHTPLINDQGEKNHTHIILSPSAFHHFSFFLSFFLAYGKEHPHDAIFFPHTCPSFIAYHGSSINVLREFPVGELGLRREGVVVKPFEQREDQVDPGVGELRGVDVRVH